jgi:hypothetical protein
MGENSQITCMFDVQLADFMTQKLIVEVPAADVIYQAW